MPTIRSTGSDSSSPPSRNTRRRRRRRSSNRCDEIVSSLFKRAYQTCLAASGPLGSAITCIGIMHFELSSNPLLCSSNLPFLIFSLMIFTGFWLVIFSIVENSCKRTGTSILLLIIAIINLMAYIEIPLFLIFDKSNTQSYYSNRQSYYSNHQYYYQDQQSLFLNKKNYHSNPKSCQSNHQIDQPNNQFGDSNNQSGDSNNNFEDATDQFGDSNNNFVDSNNNFGDSNDDRKGDIIGLEQYWPIWAMVNCILVCWMVRFSQKICPNKEVSSSRIEPIDIIDGTSVASGSIPRVDFESENEEKL